MKGSSEEKLKDRISRSEGQTVAGVISSATYKTSLTHNSWCTVGSCASHTIFTVKRLWNWPEVSIYTISIDYFSSMYQSHKEQVILKQAEKQCTLPQTKIFVCSIVSVFQKDRHNDSKRERMWEFHISSPSNQATGINRADKLIQGQLIDRI